MAAGAGRDQREPGPPGRRPVGAPPAPRARSSRRSWRPCAGSCGPSPRATCWCSCRARARSERAADQLRERGSAPAGRRPPLYGALSAGEQDAALAARAAGPAQGGAGHRHRRDEPDRRGRLDRGRRRAGAAAGVRRRHRAHPARRPCRAPGVGRPAGRAGGADRTGRGRPAVVQGRARRGRPLQRPRDPARPTWPGWPWSWRCGAPTPPTCRSSIRRRPGRWTRPARCWSSWGARRAADARPPRAGRWWPCRCTPGWPAWCSGRPSGARRGWPACWRRPLEDRDVLRGRPDDRPTDVGLRLALLDDPWPPATPWPTAARCAGPATGPETWPGGSAPPAAPRRRRQRPGCSLALAYPDRIAQARGGPGRFVLRAGTEGWLAADDALAHEPFLAVAEVDGRRRPRSHPPGRAAGAGPARRGGR